MRPRNTYLAVAAAASLACPTARAFVGPAKTAAARASDTSLQAEADGTSPAVGRRAFLGSVAASVALGPVLAPPSPANAVLGGAAKGARVASFPGVEGVEPMYELKLSVDALAAGVKNQAQWPLIKKRLDRFFKGAILSEKNFYLGVAFQYMNDIKYDDDAAYVRMDKQARFDAMEQCMGNLERLKNDLGSGADAGTIEADARAAQDALASWFALVPPADVAAVEKLFLDVKKADADRNGVLSDEELAALPLEEQEVW
eukprot:CAMPEP_0183296098 /NCGR_PEP_ID=MMETSP0160_2-20130417/3802_1 /TAXON_ID=2839 ORGANISM="Odontella Sinensis, Strain Grunow 1884" /NCGR_SAMPLE_ID=MMETSP0160_2 /ASSEMBLY_ACC=CAM_ASM_000250 /LENGTH=257 /DNA_ID=CAMNT_0025457675 /DNA_START=106 /DNA_END=876 /DNA_ORIENTATION=+